MTILFVNLLHLVINYHPIIRCYNVCVSYSAVSVPRFETGIYCMRSRSYNPLGSRPFVQISDRRGRNITMVD
jgi:hypothetical protein